MSTLLNDTQQRAEFQSQCAALLIRLQRLEVVITLALGDKPSHSQIRTLVQADTELGKAALALQEAARLIGGLK